MLHHRAGFDCPTPTSPPFPDFCNNVARTARPLTGKVVVWNRQGGKQRDVHASPDTSQLAGTGVVLRSQIVWLKQGTSATPYVKPTSRQWAHAHAHARPTPSDAAVEPRRRALPSAAPGRLAGRDGKRQRRQARPPTSLWHDVSAGAQADDSCVQRNDGGGSEY